MAEKEMSIAAFEELSRPSVIEGWQRNKELHMGRGILLWLLGVPIPVIILLALIWH
jgi:hypothetical protein